MATPKKTKAPLTGIDALNARFASENVTVDVLMSDEMTVPIRIESGNAHVDLVGEHPVFSFVGVPKGKRNSVDMVIPFYSLGAWRFKGTSDIDDENETDETEKAPTPKKKPAPKKTTVNARAEMRNEVYDLVADVYEMDTDQWEGAVEMIDGEQYSDLDTLTRALIVAYGGDVEDFDLE
jgi:hypothetical protein